MKMRKREWKEFFWRNVLNLSNRGLTENEIRILEKRLNFVPKSEKIDCYQIKKDLERRGRDNKLRMYYKTEPTQHSLKNRYSKLLQT